MSNRKGDWIQTYTGKAFWPMDPRAEEVEILDIAHSLAHQCRYGGHAKHFYSVAEHCVLLSHAVHPTMAFAALMHDAAEAYLVDVPRPIKRYLAGYKEIEEQLERVILPVFGLAYPNPAEVMDADTRILGDERRQVMATPPLEWHASGHPLGVTVMFWEPAIARTAFLRRFQELRP